MPSISTFLTKSIRNFEAEILWKNKELHARSQVKVPYKKENVYFIIIFLLFLTLDVVLNVVLIRHMKSVYRVLVGETSFYGYPLLLHILIAHFLETHCELRLHSQQSLISFF